MSAPAGAAALRPVLYLDVDDVLVCWANFERSPARAAREFLAWAHDHFEVRWLTRRCPDGAMPDWCVGDLAQLLGVEEEVFARTPGLDWSECASKLNGIAWLEHVVLGRPFVWLDDEHGAGALEQAFLAEHGFAHALMLCDVSMDPDALARAFAVLAGHVSAVGDDAANGGIAAGDTRASAEAASVP